MKRILALAVLFLSFATAIPAGAQIFHGPNSGKQAQKAARRDQKRAAKQQRKAMKRNARAQRRAMKKHKHRI